LTVFELLILLLCYVLVDYLPLIYFIVMLCSCRWKKDAAESNSPRKTIWLWTWSQWQRRWQQQQHPAHRVLLVPIK